MSDKNKGNNKLIIIGASIVALILIVVVGVVLLGNKDKEVLEEVKQDDAVSIVEVEDTKEDEVKEEIVNEDFDESRSSEALVDKEDPSVWEFTSEIFEWSVGTPLFNPIGEEELLTRLDHELFDEADLDYYGLDLYETTREVFGESWYVNSDILENEQDIDRAKYIRDLKRHVESLGGTIEGLTNDGFVFYMTDEEDIHWWGEASRSRDTLQLFIIKENEVKVGEKVIFNTADYEDNEIFFTTYNLDKEFINATIEIQTGQLAMELKQRTYKGEYERYIRYNKYLDSEVETRFVLDDLPKDQGVTYWELTWNDDEKDPKEIVIELENLGDLVDVNYGEDFGAVLISAKYARSINMRPLNAEDLSLKHPEYNEDSLYMDKTAEGDYLVYLPSGDWIADISPTGDSVVASYSTGMIPVNAGEITEIKVPLSIETAINRDLDQFLNEQGLKIDKVVEKGNTVEFDFTLVDKETKTILPTIKNTKIREGGADVKIIDITSVKTPPSVVLLLDSSGSMKGQMDATLTAAAAFIEGLPDGTNIQMIDFDDEPRILDGTTKAEAVTSLDQIVVGGSTALYDSIVMGLDLLDDLERPTLVAFTDGEDENHTVPGSGSATSKEEALVIVEESGIQVLTIGFGEGHDGTTLKEIGEAGHGHYFSADDQEALTSVFTAINEKINSTYTATYERPSESAPSDVPVVNIVVDISGSMDSDWNEETGFRMEKMKNLFHEFVEGLPEGTQMQLMAFNTESYIKQIMTSDKLKIYSALGELEAGGGTDILGSVDAGFRTLNTVPSSKKVMLYLTDAALGVEEEDQESFERTLFKINEEQMNILWIGLGEDLNEEDFNYAATMSGGEYVISEDPSILSEATNRLLSKIDQQKDSINTSIAIQVNKKDENGLLSPYSASELVELPPIPVVGMIELADSVNYVTGKVLKQYDEVSAKYLTGDSLPQESVKILKRIPLEESASNEAFAINLSEMLYLSQLKGVEAPRGMRYITLLGEFEHILPEQEVVVYPDGSGHPANWVGSANSQGVVKKAKVPYQIPDVFSHLSLSYNNDGMYPLSTATWVANKSMVIPGTSQLTLMPETTNDGALVFLVPDEAMEQISLHYYDVNYGHINLPIVGEMNVAQLEIDQLPEDITTKLSDGFSLTISGEENTTNVANMIESNKNNNFTLLEGRFSSNVQANISINPAERMHMEYPTTNGSFLVPLDDVTELLPLGMLNDMIVSPGAINQVRYAFNNPIALNNNKHNLFIDLGDEDAIVKAADGDVYDQVKNLGSGTHEYASIDVNGLFRVEEDVAGLNEYYVIADITIHDVKDGFASRGMVDNIKLVEAGHDINELYNEDKFEEFDRKLETALNSGGLSSFSSSSDFSHPHVLGYRRETDDLILGFDDDTIIYDGTSRRGFVVFNADRDLEFSLQSNFFEGLNVSLGSSTMDYGLLTDILVYDYRDNFQRDLEVAINNAIDNYKAKYPSNASGLIAKTDLDDSTIDKNEVLPPMTSIYGSQVFENMKSIEELETLIRSIEIKHGNGVEDRYVYKYYHSPEAVISQGWGTVSDVANLAIKGLTKLGYNPKRRIVALTDVGQEKMRPILNTEYDYYDILPALVFEEDRQEETWVIPFMESVENLQNSCYYAFDYDIEYRSYYDNLTIEYLIEPNGKNANDQVNDINNALGGGSSSNEPYYEEVFSQRIDYSLYSMDSIDIGTTVNEEGYTARVLTANGALVGEDGVDTNKYNILAIRLTISGSGERMYHETVLPDGVAIEDSFITVGMNLPELSETAFNALMKESDAIYNKAELPDELSALRWSARRAINQFLYTQVKFENEMEEAYGFDAARLEQDSAIVIVQLVDKGELITHMDLLNCSAKTIADNDFIDDHEADIHSFNMMAGLNASMLESQVIGGGYGFNEVWDARPKGASIVFYDFYENYDDHIDELKAEGYTDEMIEYFLDCDNYILIQEKPTIINGEERWAWLETDHYTFETIGMLDTFEHGAMTSKAIIEYEKNAANYIFGAMAGIDASLWTVCAFTLEIPDYNAMKKAAFAYAMGLKDGTGAKDGMGSVDFGGTPELSVSLGDIKIKVDQGGLSINENFLGYSNGFAEGVAIYFSRMP